MNVIEVVGAIFAGLITVAIASVIFKPGSTAPGLVTASGNAFAAAVTGAKS